MNCLFYHLIAKICDALSLSWRERSRHPFPGHWTPLAEAVRECFSWEPWNYSFWPQPAFHACGCLQSRVCSPCRFQSQQKSPLHAVSSGENISMIGWFSVRTEGFVSLLPGGIVCDCLCFMYNEDASLLTTDLGVVYHSALKKVAREITNAGLCSWQLNGP